MYNTNDLTISIFAILVIILVYVALIGLLLVNYILSANAMYKLSKRRNIPNPWMAWIPVLSAWNMGLVANEYDGHLGMKRKWNQVMVIAYCIFIGTYIIVFVAAIALMIITALQGDNVQMHTIIAPIIILYLLLLIVMLGAVLINFLHYILLFKVFESTVPEKAVKYIILSLTVPLASAICLTRCADKGYPFPEEELIYTEPVITE